MSESGSFFGNEPAVAGHARPSLHRKIRDHIQRGQTTEALGELDRLSASNDEPETVGRILTLTAYSEYRRAHYDEAALIYGKAFRIAAESWVDWWPPALGEVRSLVAAANTEEAKKRADFYLDVAGVKQAAYHDHIQKKFTQLEKTGSTDIPAPPPLPGSLAAKLGEIFFQQGEPILAKSYYSLAMKQAGGEAPRAGIGLARLALREGDLAATARFAAEALSRGKYRVKTLAAWPLLVAAECQQHSTPLLDESLAALARLATPNVQARALLAVVVELRTRGIPRWETLASSWLAKPAHPAVEAEFHKLHLATLRNRAAAPRLQLEAAAAIMLLPRLSFQEWLTAAKIFTRSQFQLGQQPDFRGITSEAARFGPEAPPAATHSLALTCLEAGERSTARHLFEQNLSTLIPTSRYWQKTAWRAAELSSLDGEHPRAAELFERISTQSTLPQRFRLQALVRWAGELTKLSDAPPLAHIQQRLDHALASVTDYDILLDLARQLVDAQSDLNDLAGNIFARGESMAILALDGAEHPADATTILLNLSRRRCDFAEYHAVTRQWEALSAQRTAWLWSPRNDFWEYLCYVHRSYTRSDRAAQARALASTYLDDPATPPEAIAMLGALQGLMETRQSRWPQARTLFQRMAGAAPRNPQSAYAHYWLALMSRAVRQETATRRHAEDLLRSLGNDPKIKWQREKWLQAHWLLDHPLLADTALIPPAEKQKAIQRLQADLDHLRAG